MDTRTGEVASPYACPSRLLAPAIVEEWLTADEIGRLTETDALIRTRRRWADARDEYTRSVDADARHLRARAAQLCGPVSRPVWAKDAGQPWHMR
ncbi:hypothetical protein DBP15_28535 [Streptomyces sp. CS065A]|nr:hypothetical protein DBP15_28535 [Streptomyces sp. CS065A]